MKFTKEIAETTKINVEESLVRLRLENDLELEMHIGEAVDVAVWTPHGKLLVTLRNGQLRLYSDTINFEDI